MDRIATFAYAEAIGEAVAVIEAPIMALLQHIDFLAGVDPIFAGLHAYDDGWGPRSYRTTAHVCYPYHCLNRRERTTVVLPTLQNAKPYVVCHELGHCLDEVLAFGHDALPVDDYAATNRREAFAEAFTFRYYWTSAEVENKRLSDVATCALFDALARGERARCS
jgi:hypothetical protein